MGSPKHFCPGWLGAEILLISGGLMPP
jgi:hypothetical protein